ncbi:hypothetical protein SESBI_05640 [Sesbania bispinosa]|nr:hypothetical protein SESBI_05640 [Sesbania bispinosa]
MSCKKEGPNFSIRKKEKCLLWLEKERGKTRGRGKEIGEAINLIGTVFPTTIRRAEVVERLGRCSERHIQWRVAQLQRGGLVTFSGRGVAKTDPDRD